MKTLLRLAVLLLAPLASFAATEVAADPAALAAKGNAAWRAESRGDAVLQWERALILDPRQPAARAGLAVAEDAGAKSPALQPVEVYAAVLPEDVWAILAAAAFWIGVVALALPRVSRFPRRSAHHTIAGCCAAILLLALPGVYGAIRHRDRGVVLSANTALSLTPTATAETVQRLEAGDRVRVLGAFGDFRRVLTADGTSGWIKKASVAPMIPE